MFHHLLNGPDGDRYARPLLFGLSSRERVDQLLVALQALVDRHDTLRTAVLWQQLPQPVQVVLRGALVPVEEVVLDPDSLRQLDERASSRKLRLELHQAPLIRAQVIARADGGHWRVLVCTHHFVCDNQSISILLEELASHLDRHSGDLPQPVAYRNHVAQAVGYARTYDAQAFFHAKLREIDEPTAPFGVLDVHGHSSQLEGVHQKLNIRLAKRIRTHARRLGVSAAALFHASWALVVSRTSGRTDVVFGTVLLGRLQSSAGAQRILGMFINTLPLKVSLQGLTAKTLVAQTQRELIELLGQEQASLAQAQRCSGIHGSAPLFTSLLNYRHSIGRLEPVFNASGVDLLATSGQTNYPILLSVDDQGADFMLEIAADQRIGARRMLRLHVDSDGIVG